MNADYITKLANLAAEERRQIAPNGWSNVHRGKGMPDCPVCGGLGYVTYDVPDGHALFGKAQQCNCYAHTDEATTRRLLAAGIRHSQIGLGNLSTDPPEQAQARAALYALWERMSGLLVLRGAFGSGKTELARGLVRDVVDAGGDARYITAGQYAEALKASFGDAAVRASDIVAGYGATQLLVIDEIEQMRMTDWAHEVIFQLVNARYDARHSAATIFVFSHEYLELLPGDMRVMWSRMSEGAVVDVGRRDLRPTFGAARR